VNGVAILEICFASPKGGRATGLLLVPAGPGPFPGVVVQNGAPGRVDSRLIAVLRTHVMANAMAVAQAGAVAIALEAPWARRLEPPVTFTTQDSVDQVHLIVDLQRAVDVLLARSDVDPARLGYVGRSYGGAMGALLAGVERRIRAYVLQVGDGGLVSHFTLGEVGAAPPPGIDPAAWERWLRAMRPLEPIRFVGRARPAALLLQSARQDQAVSTAAAIALHEAASEPKTVTWYGTGHGLSPEATGEMLAWLGREIGLRRF
ncbi:MAG: alpha/beta hydrolase family protein, partial [Gemmatimonadales bacterium]